MSLSNLSAQLANLNSKTGVPSSKQHSESVGRGIHHSSKHGHAILNQHNPKHKPSVIHQDSKTAAAADVPYTTLRENAVTSLQYLMKHTQSSSLYDLTDKKLPFATLLGPKSVNFERGLNTKETNVKYDALLKEALVILSTSWGDAANTVNGSSILTIQLGANKPSSVLHVLEYLVQKYYVHLHTPEALLMAFLPHHETFLFERILQLVDLGQFSHWSFLRPYSGGTTGGHGVPRTVISKWAASTKDNGGGTALLKIICDLAKRVAKIHAREKVGLVGDDEDNLATVEARKGVSLILSFSAAVLMETLHIQNATAGTVNEATLRCIIPYILGAVEPHASWSSSSTTKKSKSSWSLGTLCPEWRSFGYVVISVLIEKCECSTDLCDTLATSIIKGSAEMIQYLQYHDQDENMMEDEDVISSMTEVEVASQSLLIVMSILTNTPPTKTNKRTFQSVLPTIKGTKGKSKEGHLGYNMSFSTFHALMEFAILPQALGYLAQEKEIEVNPILGSLAAMCVSYNSHQALKGKKKSCKLYVDQVNRLIQESSLKESWLSESDSLTISFAGFIISPPILGIMKEKSFAFKHLSALLKSIRQIDPVGCDAGIGHIITMIASLKDGSERENASKNAKKFLKTIGIINAERKDSPGQKNKTMELLPSRVALEHPDADLRCRAIEDLLTEVKEMTEAERDQVALGFMRRFASDDNIAVVVASARAIQNLSSNESVTGDFFSEPSTIDNTISGLQKWSLVKKTKSDSRKDKKKKNQDKLILVDSDVDALSESLVLAGIICRRLTASLIEGDSFNGKEIIEDIPEDVYNLVMEIAVQAQLAEDITNNDVKKAALTALLTGLGEEDNAGDMKMLGQNNLFHSIINNCINDISVREPTLKDEKLLQFFLSKVPSEHTQESAALSLLAIYGKKKEGKDSSSAQYNELQIHLEKIATSLLEGNDRERTIQFIIQLSSVQCNSAFEEASLHAMNTFRDESFAKHKTHNPILLLLLETCSRPAITNTTVIQRLLTYTGSILDGVQAKDSEHLIKCSVITFLGFLRHTDLEVRKCALKNLQTISSIVEKHTTLEVLGDLYSLVRDENSPSRLGVLMDGNNGLPHILKKSLQNSANSSKLSKVLLQSCVSSLLTMNDTPTSFHSQFSEGNSNTVSIILSAMESAGESSFPLAKRWEEAGKPLLTQFLEQNFEDPVPVPVISLIESVIAMLKGVTVDDHDGAEGILIATGPSGSGRRLRSYSIGQSSSASYIQPYPSSMIKSIELCFATAIGKKDKTFSRLCEAMNYLVLGRSSWSTGIFPTLTKTTKRRIAMSLLELKTDLHMDSAGAALLGLSLDASEFTYLVTDKKSPATRNDSNGLLALTVIADCVREQSQSLSKEHDLNTLTSIIFTRLSELSKTENEGFDYTRYCLLQTLSSLYDHDMPSETSSRGRRKQDQKNAVGKYAELIVDLLGTRDDGKTPLLSSKSRSLALSLLTRLCSISPPTVVHYLVPAMGKIMSSDSVEKETSANLESTAKRNIFKDSLMAILPAFCEHAENEGLTLTDLLKSFLTAGLSGNEKAQLFHQLINALSLTSSCDNVGIAIASAMGVFIASELFDNDKSKNHVDEGILVQLYSQLLSHINPTDQIEAALQMSEYASTILSSLYIAKRPSGQHMNERSEFMVVSDADLFEVVVNGSLKEKGTGRGASSPTEMNSDEQKSLMSLVTAFLEIVQTTILSSSNVQRAIRNLTEKANICLKLWQTLMIIQSNLVLQQDMQSNVKKFMKKTELQASSSLTTLQRLLPVPYFLASISSIIQEKDYDVDLQKKAISLLAERSVGIDASLSEADLFLETIPDLIQLIQADTNENKGQFVALRQSCCNTLDQLAKNLGLGVVDKKLVRKRAAVFMPAFETLTNLLHNEEKRSLKAEEYSSLGWIQFISSVALCTSTLVTLLKARSLAELPKFIKSLISLLSRTNKDLKSIPIDNLEQKHALKLLQLSLLRALIAVSETLPQFMTSHLSSLLSPAVLPSKAIRQKTTEDDASIQNMAERLDSAIVKGTPVRQLMPFLCKAIVECFDKKETEKNTEEIITLLDIVRSAVTKSSRNDLGPIVGKIVSASIQIYSYDTSEKVERAQLLTATNDTLLALIMKLSEVQLRQLFAKLRHWRGDLIKTDTDRQSVLRRQSFYSLSAAISKELRSIFLPCMSSISGDIVEELEYVVSIICAQSKQSLKGNKRRKLESEEPFNYDAASPLQPLLLCLETTLRADAHEGGNWIRSDNGSRFNTLLKPLGKLLQANVGAEFEAFIDFDDTAQNMTLTPYEKLIAGNGTDEHGNVMGCLTALAAAAGNEQLWKPLNHSILEACGCEERSEVRKSGVKTLLSIIQTLGEEYMVLLPECLPVLSELLEDEDDDIVFLAKECVRQGEELLGESLEDSLR